ncbi:MAG TPA: tetratricopeptide repeat protein [Chitinophaga sp.]|uniref:tetratricopeptide repeat protein n=1 Tax=Chitinophaga sp. TaxID=1869181 RepID=UPI002DB7BFBD|nr:tetratricopeptide repeat protein [Chitinophaga sp.]HEU4553226.1 tetratricopeptide repeat protein [Chitinophaga sp.]
MNRRKSLIVALLCVANGVMAQSVEDGLKDIYYGKYRSAIGTFEKVNAAKPDERAYYYEGIAQLSLEHKDSAAAVFQKGLQAVPNSPLLQVGMGRIDLMNGNTAAAKQKFEAASTATEGRNGDVARAIADANTSVKGGDRGYALTIMEKLLNNEGRRRKEQYTATVADYIEMGDAYRALGGENGGKAISTYDKALELDPNNAEAIMKQGLVNYNAKLLQEAVNDWTKATNVDPKYAPAYFELFEFYITPKKNQLSWDNAATYLQKYMEVGDPADKLKNEYYLAAISFYKKDYEAAITKAKSVMPTVTEPEEKAKFTRLVADAYLQKGDSMTAKQTMDEYVKAVGDSKLEANDYKLLSEIYGRVKIQDSAQAAITDSLASVYLEKYATLDTTKDVDHYREVAEKFKSLRDYARSAQWYGKLATDFTDEQNPGKIQDYFWKGTMEIYANKPADADSTFGAFVAKYPNQEALGLYWRGRANMLNDREAKEGTAVPYFQKFFEVGGESKMKSNLLMYPYQYMMIYYYNKEDKENLKTWMDKVLALNPNDQAAKQIQENMASTAKASTKAQPATQNKK